MCVLVCGIQITMSHFVFLGRTLSGDILNKVENIHVSRHSYSKYTRMIVLYADKLAPKV